MLHTFDIPTQLRKLTASCALLAAAAIVTPQAADAQILHSLSQSARGLISKVQNELTRGYNRCLALFGFGGQGGLGGGEATSAQTNVGTQIELSDAQPLLVMGEREGTQTEIPVLHRQNLKIALLGDPGSPANDKKSMAPGDAVLALFKLVQQGTLGKPGANLHFELKDFTVDTTKTLIAEAPETGAKVFRVGNQLLLEREFVPSDNEVGSRSPQSIELSLDELIKLLPIEHINKIKDARARYEAARTAIQQGISKILDQRFPDPVIAEFEQAINHEHLLLGELTMFPDGARPILAFGIPKTITNPYPSIQFEGTDIQVLGVKADSWKIARGTFVGGTFKMTVYDRAFLTSKTAEVSAKELGKFMPEEVLATQNSKIEAAIFNWMKTVPWMTLLFDVPPNTEGSRLPPLLGISRAHWFGVDTRKFDGITYLDRPTSIDFQSLSRGEGQSNPDGAPYVYIRTSVTLPKGETSRVGRVLATQSRATKDSWADSRSTHVVELPSGEKVPVMDVDIVPLFSPLMSAGIDPVTMQKINYTAGMKVFRKSDGVEFILDAEAHPLLWQPGQTIALRARNALTNDRVVLTAAEVVPAQYWPGKFESDRDPVGQMLTQP